MTARGRMRPSTRSGADATFTIRSASRTFWVRASSYNLRVNRSYVGEISQAPTQNTFSFTSLPLENGVWVVSMT